MIEFKKINFEKQDDFSDLIISKKIHYNFKLYVPEINIDFTTKIRKNLSFFDNFVKNYEF